MQTKHYELFFIIPAQYTEEELEPIRDQVRELIKKHNGTITRDELWEKRKLAYPIKHVHQGYYILMELDLDAAAIKPLDSEMKLVTDVLRHLLVAKTAREIEEEEKMQKRIADRQKAKAAQDEDGTEGEVETTEPKKETKEAPAKEESTPLPTPSPTEPEPVVKEVEKVEKPKMTLEEVDKKLDQILEQDAF